jgi:hypothetical protein
LTPAFVQKARAEHKAGLSPGESHLDDVVEAAAEKLRKALAAKSAAKLRGEIERIAQGHTTMPCDQNSPPHHV